MAPIRSSGLLLQGSLLCATNSTLSYYNDALEAASDWVLWKNSVNDGLSQRLATTSIDRLEDENWTPRTTRQRTRRKESPEREPAFEDMRCLWKALLVAQEMGTMLG